MRRYAHTYTKSFPFEILYDELYRVLFATAAMTPLPHCHSLTYQAKYDVNSAIAAMGKNELEKK